jgi:hypothetical protein
VAKNAGGDAGRDPYVEKLVQKGNWKKITQLARAGNKAAIGVKYRREFAAASKPAK